MKINITSFLRRFSDEEKALLNTMKTESTRYDCVSRLAVESEATEDADLKRTIESLSLKMKECTDEEYRFLCTLIPLETNVSSFDAEEEPEQQMA